MTYEQVLAEAKPARDIVPLYDGNGDMVFCIVTDGPDLAFRVPAEVAAEFRYLIFEELQRRAN
jgi:hypothetical protein